jgi:hypothetical protein
MHAAFYRSEKERCQQFAGVFHTALLAQGDTVTEYPIFGDVDNQADAIVMFRVRRKELLDHAEAQQIPLLYFDKGYTRTHEWQRIAFDGTEPGFTLGTYGFPDDRRKAFKWEPRPWRTSGNHIVLASSNEVEHEWRGLPAPQEYATEVARQIRRFTDRPIIHRCKPNQSPIFSVPRTTQSPQGRTVQEDLRGAHVLVTVGSSIVLESVLSGVPTIVLGDAVTVNISSDDLARIENPLLVSPKEVIAVLNDLAYHQWSWDEFKSGVAWAAIRPMLVKKVL